MNSNMNVSATMLEEMENTNVNDKTYYDEEVIEAQMGDEPTEEEIKNLKEVLIFETLNV